jgi:hypothetical protein
VLDLIECLQAKIERIEVDVSVESHPSHFPINKNITEKFKYTVW